MKMQHYKPYKLSGLVDLIWEGRYDTPFNLKILPTARVELIFNLSSEPNINQALKINNRNSPLKHFCFLSGLHTQPLDLQFERFYTIGLQMKPVAIKALWGIPSCEVRDYYNEGKLIIKDLQCIEDKLKSNISFLEKARWLEDYIYNRVNETANLHQAIKLHDTCENFIQNKTYSGCSTIHDMLGYSRTQTFRIFNEWFGLSSHSYQKLIQFVQSVHHLHTSTGNLTENAGNNGFYDQAHFIRSFKSFSGMTPGEYRKQMTHIPGQLFS